MNTPIKYRAWDKKEELMFVVSRIDFSEDGAFQFLLDKDNHFPKVQVSKNIELMQYTGLKDKNGKEIYEGDIVKTIPTAFQFQECEGEVFWFQGQCRYALRNVDHYMDNLATYEITGNIYEVKEGVKE